MISRRLFLGNMALLWATRVGTAFGQQPYPSRGIRLIVPQSPGSSADSTARFLANALSEEFGVSVQVDNRPGAGVVIGTEAAAKATPDGYTLLVTGSTHYVVKWFSDTVLPYDPIKDFTPLVKVNSTPGVLVVPINSPIRTLGDLIDAMRDRPDKLAFSSGGIGTFSHVCSAMLGQAAQTRALHVAYKGAAPAVTDVVSGQVQFTCASPTAALPLIQAGRLRAIAVTTRSRWSSLPETPTVSESGIPGFVASAWLGVLAPAGIPSPVANRLSEALVRITHTAEFAEFCKQQSLIVDVAARSEIQKEIAKEDEEWRALAQGSKFR